MSVSVGETESDSLADQIGHATVFLNMYRGELMRLVAFPGIEEVGLDFAIEWGPDAVTQTDHLPADFIRIAGALDLDIELSHYPVTANESI